MLKEDSIGRKAAVLIAAASPGGTVRFFRMGEVVLSTGSSIATVPDNVVVHS